MDCIRRLSLEFAISRRILFSSNDGGVFPAFDTTDATAADVLVRDIFGVTGDSAFSLFKLRKKKSTLELITRIIYKNKYRIVYRTWASCLNVVQDRVHVYMGFTILV